MIEIALVMVRAPNPPGSRQLISPPGAVLEMAPANVLHGAVRLHGLASSPTPDTQVLVAWAEAGSAQAKPAAKASASHETVRVSILIMSTPLVRNWTRLGAVRHQ